jgi:microcystin-dependent protein
MSVEAATYISDLDPTKPGVGDQKSEGDDHIRLIKAVLKATLADIGAYKQEPIGSLKAWPGIALPDSLWDWADGGTLSRAGFPTLFAKLVKSATVTITIAAPGVVSWATHGLRNNLPVKFSTTGALPTGITPGTTYYIKNATANDFQISATVGGAAINTSGTQSGVHTAVCAPHGDGDGSTTFNKPDLRGRVPVGRDDQGGSAANRMTGAFGPNGLLLGASGGAESDTLDTTKIPAHSHPVTDPGHDHPGSAAAHTHTIATALGGFSALTSPGAGTNYQTTGGGGSQGSTGPTAITATDSTSPAVTVSSNTTGVTTNNTGGGAAHNNTQPSFVTDWIIKVA